MALDFLLLKGGELSEIVSLHCKIAYIKNFHGLGKKSRNNSLNKKSSKNIL